MNVELLKKTEIYKTKLQIFEKREKELTDIWRDCLDKKSKKKYNARTALKKHCAKKSELLDIECWTDLEITLLLEDLCGILGNDEIGGKWTQEERDLYDQNRTSSEGRGEKSFRFRMGLPVIQGSSSRDCDTPGKEVKEWIVSSACSKHNLKLEAIRITKKTQSYTAMCYDIGELNGKGEISLSDEQSKSIKKGELSLKDIQTLPERVVNMFRDYTTPDKVMSSYPKMGCVSPNGFIMFDKSEYNELWALNQITQGGPKYKAVRAYLMRKIFQISELIEASATQHQPPSLEEVPQQTPQNLQSEELVA